MRRLLVCTSDCVGDAVMSLPALQALRRQHPAVRITVLARPWVADIYAREPFSDEVIRYTSPRGWKNVRGKLQLVRELRGHEFDTALLLQNAFEAAALVRLAG